MRRAAARHGAGLIALSPWRLSAREDASTRADLRAALAAPRVVFTSPAAVRAARTLQAFAPRPGQIWCAVGTGTAAALRRAGVSDVQVPARMDSEGLLALPPLQDLAGLDVGLITAPGGRGEIAPALQARGARLRRADVYAREPVAPSPRGLQQLRSIDTPLVLALSSGDALDRALASLPDDLVHKLRSARVVAASARLAARARERGFADVVRASGPRPADLLASVAGSAAAFR